MLKKHKNYDYYVHYMTENHYKLYTASMVMGVFRFKYLAKYVGYPSPDDMPTIKCRSVIKYIENNDRLHTMWLL